MTLLKTINASDFQPDAAPRPLDEATLAAAESIVSDVREGGRDALIDYAKKFDGHVDGQPLLLGRDALTAAKDRLDAADLALLERVASRVRDFAQGQLNAMSEMEMPVPGGKAGHSIVPVQRAGCYAPAGRYALPSTVIMTVVPAVVAGCDQVVLATPGTSDLMLAAAAVAGADYVLAVGGAQAVAAMAYGFEGFERCDAVSYTHLTLPTIYSV